MLFLSPSELGLLACHIPWDLLFDNSLELILNQNEDSNQIGSRRIVCLCDVSTKVVSLLSLSSRSSSKKLSEAVMDGVSALGGQCHGTFLMLR